MAKKKERKKSKHGPHENDNGNLGILCVKKTDLGQWSPAINDIYLAENSVQMANKCIQSEQEQDMEVIKNWKCQPHKQTAKSVF